MRNAFQKLPIPIQLLLLVYGCGMMIFFAFRLVLLFLFWNEAKSIPDTVILESLFMGFRFDTVISGYILILPLVIHFLFSFFIKDEKTLIKIVFNYLFLFYTISFFILCADIPWFRHFDSRFTIASLGWTNTPGMMLKIVFEDFYNYPFLALFVILIFAFWYLLRKIRSFVLVGENVGQKQWKTAFFYLLAIGMLFIGIRGRIAFKSPIRWGTACFSSYNLTNQLGLNPVYTFMRSWLDNNEGQAVSFHYMNDTDAERILRDQLKITATDTSVSPVARKFNSKGAPNHFNVVLVLIESMSAKNMQHFGNKNNLTPVLDSLYDHSISFTDFYSDGIHTFNGIYSSLFGFHSLPMAHHMKDLRNLQPYGGLAKTLTANGYSTVFFTTHDDQFDNMAGFLLPNGFQKIIAQKDFSQKEILSTLGVPDHVLFHRTVQEVDLLHQQSKPFFAAIMTGSNHGPYILPENIPLVTHSGNLKDKLVEYSDWAIGNFLKEKASGYSWFDSTIFIFTGDHGALIEGFDRYLSFHHVPLIIHAPKILVPKTMEALGGQTDLWPTIAGLLQVSYVNNSMGMDLFSENRICFPFTYDEEQCSVSKENLWVVNHGKESFFTISPDKKTIVQSPRSPITDSMKAYQQAAIQITQEMILQRKMKN